MLKIVYLATPEIAVNAVEQLLNFSDIQKVVVVTMPDRPAGRGSEIKESPIKQFAVKNNITLFQTPSISRDKELMQTLKKLKPDFFITFAFGQLLSQEVIDIPKYCVINLHASLLPKYRGANPIQWAVINGDRETGITTMKTVLKMDAGDICLSEKIDITENMSVPELAKIISEKAPNLLYKTIKGISENTLVSITQEESLVTFAPKFKKEDGIIDFDLPANVFHNKVRGLQPWPNAYICRNERNIQILETELPENANVKAVQGEILCIDKNGMTIMCSDRPILIKFVKPANKAKMHACDFANGVRLKKGDIL